MKYLGIDPGTTRIGYGLIEKKGNIYAPLEWGLIGNEKELIKMPLPNKLLAIYNAFNSLLVQHKPNLIGLEGLFFSKNVKTALPVAMARGVLLLCATQHNIRVIEPTPNQVKQGVTGNGSANKTQVTNMVVRLLGFKAPPKPDDVADALAIAITVSNISLSLLQ